MLKFINAGSNIDLTRNEAVWIDSLLSYERAAMYEWFDDRREYSIARRTFDTPVFLVDEAAVIKQFEKEQALIMQNSDEDKAEHIEEMRRAEQHADIPPMELLGFYQRAGFGFFKDTPVIVISPEKIAQYAGNYREYQALLALVIAHELAHAQMDPYGESRRYRKRDLFFEWMEESLANCIALKFFDDYDRWFQRAHFLDFDEIDRVIQFEMEEFHELEAFVRNFVRRQPPRYALGFHIKKRCHYWRDWVRAKKELHKQEHDGRKEAWLKYAMQHFDPRGEEFFGLYDDLFGNI